MTINRGGDGPDLVALGEYFWNLFPLMNLEVRSIVPYLVEELGAGPVLACAWRGDNWSSAGRFIDLSGDSRSHGLS
ncbi:MAG: hypothetical protein CML55_04815 [Rhodobacteraceae bacterium]|nr:hypothetical protein [Paracoccaceae bacterium]